MFGICHHVIYSKTVNDRRHRVLEIGERIKVATERDRVLGGKDGMGSIGFHNTSRRQPEPL